MLFEELPFAQHRRVTVRRRISCSYLLPELLRSLLQF